MIEGERKLATIRRIAATDPIPGADAIEKLTIDGWELVSGKGNFRPGDLCVYFEIDSFIPTTTQWAPHFEFLRDRCFKSTAHLGDGFRLRTIKLRGQVSQGLAMPLRDFFQDGSKISSYSWAGDGPDPDVKDLVEGDDVTAYLGILKWEPAPSSGGGGGFNAGRAASNFPAFLRKTDQERAQNCLRKIQNWIYWTREIVDVASDRDPVEFWDGHWYDTDLCTWRTQKLIRNSDEVIAERQVFEATLKLDGSSMTVYHNEGKLGVCSRNFDLKREEDSLFWNTALDVGAPIALFISGKNAALQGELMGPGVQKNREKLEKRRFFVFDVFDIDEQRYMTSEERMKFLFNAINPFDYDIELAPVVDQKYVIREDTTVADLLSLADSVKSLTVDVAEGIVFKSLVPEGPSFKIISNRFLLKETD